ncbi:MAG: galactose mutarotase [Myxococcota bacterium]
MTPFETIVLHDEANEARAVLAPQRGGMLTRWSVAGRSLLYLDEATLADPARNVRGGNPVLFPSPGPLVDDRFERAGRQGQMKQHGLARRHAFSVVEQKPTRATLRLEPTADMREQFPWDFELTLRYALTGSTLTLGQLIANRDSIDLPFALGFHPYFAVPSADKGRAAIPTRATRAWDNVAKRAIELSGPISLGAGEVDLHLDDHGSNEATLELPDGARIHLRGSEAFGRWVIWTLPDRDFVCLEPWTAPVNALNTGQNLLTVGPGQTRALEVAFTLLPA